MLAKLAGQQEWEKREGENEVKTSRCRWLSEMLICFSTEGQASEGGELRGKSDQNKDRIEVADQS